MRSAPYQTSVDLDVGGDEHVRLVSARLQPMLGAQQSQLLLDRRQKDEVALSLDAAAIERAKHFENGHQVRCIVAHARRAQSVTFALYFQVRAFREYRVGMSREHHGRTAAGPFTDAAHIKYVVGPDLAQPELLHLGSNILRASLFLAGRRRNLHYAGPFVDDFRRARVH